MPYLNGLGGGQDLEVLCGVLAAIGYLGSDYGAYLQHHDPFAYFSDVQSSPTQASSIVPFTQLATDIANNSLPDYAFIAPNVNDDAHNCPACMGTCTDAQKLAAADQWLFTNISPQLASAGFQNSLLIVIFERGDILDLGTAKTRLQRWSLSAVIVSPLAK